MSFSSDNLDSVGELYTADDFRQLAVSVEATPAFFGGRGELEDHASAVLLERHPLERTVRRRLIANQLSMTLVVRRCFQCSAGEVIEGQQRVAILGQALDT